MKKLSPEQRIAGIYIVVGFVWILFSDEALTFLTLNVGTISKLSTLKGWFYVGVTGIMLYLLVRSNTRKNIRYTDELQKAKEKAEEADKLKSRFLANLSHELRTHMNAILGFSDLLNTPQLPDEKRKYYNYIIHEKTSELLKLVNNLIESARIQEGQYKIYLEQVNLNALMEKIYISQIAEIQYLNKNSIHLFNKEDASLTSLMIQTDQMKLELILRNLIYNAIKYTSKGNVTFGYEIKGNFVEFFVSDTGMGISETDQKIIFDQFVQGNGKESQKKGGAGLGLSICRAFVEMLGGKIWLDSKIGEGSTFYFTLPILK
jgi:signal transduction histidine kinase